jgi:hypothetical protein
VRGVLRAGVSLGPDVLRARTRPRARRTARRAARPVQRRRPLLLRHNGRYEFLTADDSFAYEFTDFAASGLPIQILTFSDRHFSNVTRQYPKLVTRDAARWMKAFNSMAKQHYSDSVGVAAAWAADEELLGHVKLVNSFLAKQVKAGHLNSALSPQEPGGAKFVAKLSKFLRAHGYVG